MFERDDVAMAGGRHVDAADAERVFERGDLIISMMMILGKTFRSFGKMNSIPTAASFKENFRQRNQPVAPEREQADVSCESNQTRGRNELPQKNAWNAKPLTVIDGDERCFKRRKGIVNMSYK